jgi:uncharacterized protein YbjT (DUF2867 family)
MSWPSFETQEDRAAGLQRASVRIGRLTREDEPAPWAAIPVPAQDGQDDGSR